MSTTHVNRFVVGLDGQNRSAVLQRGLTSVQSREGDFWSATLWTTQETPVDNTIAGDRSQTPGLEGLEPFPNGLICRALEIPPGARFPRRGKSIRPARVEDFRPNPASATGRL